MLLAFTHDESVLAVIAEAAFLLEVFSSRVLSLQSCWGIYPSAIPQRKTPL